MTAPADLPIRRNTVLLSASLAANSAMLQLSAAVASLTLVLVVDVEGLLGLGPAIVLGCGALAALPAGRAMDRVGRIPVLATGYVTGAVGCGLAALGSATESRAGRARRPGLRGRRERRRAAGAYRRRRHVPAGAARARHRARAVRRGLRRDPRAGRVQPAAGRARARRRGARAAVARGRRLHGGRPRARAVQCVRTRARSRCSSQPTRPPTTRPAAPLRRAAGPPRRDPRAWSPPRPASR